MLQCVCMCVCAHKGKVGSCVFLIITTVEQALALQIKDISPFLIVLNNCYRTGEQSKINFAFSICGNIMNSCRLNSL